MVPPVPSSWKTRAVLPTHARAAQAFPASACCPKGQKPQTSDNVQRAPTSDNASKGQCKRDVECRGGASAFPSYPTPASLWCGHCGVLTCFSYLSELPNTGIFARGERLTRSPEVVAKMSPAQADSSRHGQIAGMITRPQARSPRACVVGGWGCTVADGAEGGEHKVEADQLPAGSVKQSDCNDYISDKAWNQLFETSLSFSVCDL